MSRLFKIKHSPYYYYTAGSPPSRIYRSTGSSELSIAKKIKRKWDEEYILNKHKVTIPTMVLYDLIDKYFDVISPIKSSAWRERISYIIKTFKILLPNISVTDIKKYDINQYVSQRFKVAQSATIQKEIRILKNILGFAVDNQILKINVIKNIELPKSTPKQYPPFSNETLYHIFNNAIPQDLIYWKVLLYTGLRAGDGGTISKKEIKNGTITKSQQKTSKQVIIPLHKELIKLESKIIMVASTRSDRNMSYRRLKKILHKIGKDGNLHTFRHTFSTRLLELGLAAEDRQSILGWSSTAMAPVYTHPRMEYITKIINKL